MAGELEASGEQRLGEGDEAFRDASEPPSWRKSLIKLQYIDNHDIAETLEMEFDNTEGDEGQCSHFVLLFTPQDLGSDGTLEVEVDWIEARTVIRYTHVNQPQARSDQLPVTTHRLIR
jgi:hypothetical protein